LPSAPDKKIYLQRLLADLGVQLLQIGLGFFNMLGAEHAGRPLQQLVLPVADASTRLKVA